MSQQAHRNYQERQPGWYVVNPVTDIAVAHFGLQVAAEREAGHRNSTPPIAPDLLVVKQSA